MLFNSALFIFYFFPIVCLVYFLLRVRNFWLILTSAAFYFCAEPGMGFVVLIATILFNFSMAKKIEHEGPSRRLWLIFILSFNALLLIYFKYTNFLLVGVLGRSSGFNILAPLGISFFTFQLISYQFDIYDGKFNSEKNLGRFTVYVMFFAHLVAGPVVRYIEISKQLPESKGIDWDGVYLGFERIIRGLFKKVLIADVLAKPVDELYNLPILHMSPLQAWLAAGLFTLQIYFDFSGYSDIAIGIAKIFKFTFPENFNRPFLAKNLKEFWQRWHISLSTWLRDYLFIKLATVWRHLGTAGLGLALFITFAISGLWHGAAWTFVVWGLYHGILYGLEAVWLKKYLDKTPALFQHAYLVLIVMIGFIFFRQVDLSSAMGQIGRLIDLGEFRPSDRTWNDLKFDNYVWFTSLLALIWAFYPQNIPWPRWPVAKSILHLVLFILCLCEIISSTHRAFIYFQF